jgi:hypothetical protein
MNVKKSLEERIRGWFPKESNLPSNKVKMNVEKKVSDSWRRFLPLVIISYIVLIAIQVILYFLAYINLSILFGGILVLLLIIPLPYAIWHIQTKYQHSKTIQIANKLSFILAGACLAFPITFFPVAFIFRAANIDISDYVGYWPGIILLLVVPMIVGAFIGYALGKRRNFRPYR